MRSLMGYLAGPGRGNEHEEQHLVAGDAAVMALHGEAVLDGRAAAAVAVLLDEPRVFHGVEVTRLASVRDPESGEVVRSRVAADVWHCSLSLAAEEGQLTDERWGQIATEFVSRMGFAGDGAHADCRWVAVRHGVSKNGNDHVHVAVSLVREDGTKASVHNDQIRAQAVCRGLEREHGLQVLHERDRATPERGVKPAAREAAARRGAVEVDAHRLERTVRAAAAASLDEGEFVRRLRQAGVLARPRYAAGRDDVVAGYSVALRPARDEPVVWHGGGRLARDLTLPRLREAWPDSPGAAGAAVAEWQATGKNPWGYRPAAPGREVASPGPEVWQRYREQVAALTAELRAVPGTDRVAWAAAARHAAGALAVWSTRVEQVPGPLAAASRSLARSAQLRAYESRGKQVTRSSLTGDVMVLAHAARPGAAGVEALLIRELGKLARAVYEMHAAAGDARRAREVASTITRELRTVAVSMPVQDSAAETAALSEELQQVRARAQTNQGWAAGTPIPIQLEQPTSGLPVGLVLPEQTRERDDGRGR